MKRPFLHIIIPLILGIIYYYFIEINIYLTLILLITSIIISLVGIKLNRDIKLSGFILIFLLGVLLIFFKEHSSELALFVDEPVELKATIKDIRYTSKDEGSYIVTVDNIKSYKVNKNVKEKLLLKIIGEDQFELGDKLSFNATLMEPLPNTNPRLFNHKLSLLTNSIYTRTTIKDYSITHVEKDNKSFMVRSKINFVNRVEKVFDDYLDSRNSSLMKAVVLGENSYLDEENVQQYRDLGLAHILAVSGLHIGILTSILVFAMGLLGINRKLNLTLTFIIIWFYAYIIGNPPSVLRANIMFSFLLICEAYGEPYDSINILCFAVFLMVVKNPFCIFNLCFQLSFIATFSIIYLTPKIEALFYPYENNGIKTLSSLLAIQIGLFPVQAYYFNSIPLTSILANIILIPLFTIALVLCMFLILFSFISLNISWAIGIIANFLLKIQYYGVDLFYSFPYLTLKVASPSIFEIIFYYIFIFLLFNFRNIRKPSKNMSKTIVVYLLLLVALNSLGIGLDNSLEVEFIDVGQGDCALLRSRHGNYLIDTGGSLFGDFDVGKSVLLPYLEKSGIFKLDGVFISHYHADHCKSLPYLMDNMKVENIYLGYKRDENELYKDIVDKALEKDIPVFIMKKGDRLVVHRNMDILALGPDEAILHGQRDNENDLSLVLNVNYFDQSILFTGDIEEAGENSFIEDFNSSVDFLKAPHHGSKTSSSEDFLEKIDPKVCFISVGRNNSFGHPSKPVIDRYKGKGIEVYRTDEDGLISLSLNENEYKISSFMKKKWSFPICFYCIYFIISYIMVRYNAILEKEMEKIEL